MTHATPSTAGPASAPVARWSRASVVGLAVVVVAGVLLGWTARDAAFNVNGDSAIYLTLSESLGAGHYRDEYLVGTPPHAQYPPGTAVWLLLLRLVAGNGLDAIIAGNFLLIAAVACLLADAVRRLSTPWLGVTAAAVVVFNPGVIALSGGPGSEPLFLACCALALWCTVDLDKQGRDWRPAVAFAAAIAAFLTRSVGIALLPAIGIALLLHRRWRSLMLGGACSVAVVAAWFTYTRWAAQRTIGHSYADDLAGAARVDEPLRFLEHVFSIAREYFAYLATVQFNIPDIHDFPADNGFWGVLVLISAASGVRQLARRWPAVVVFLLLTTGILIVYSWYVSRLMTALLPWLVAAMLLGWLSIASAMKLRRPVLVPLVAGAVLATLAAATQVPLSVHKMGCRTAVPFSEPRCATAADRGYFAAALFIRDSLPPDAVIAASKPSSIYHNSGRLTFPLELFERERDAIPLAPEGPATNILLSRKFPYEQLGVAPRLQQRCGSLALIAEFAGGTLLLGPRTATSGDACEALAAYLRTTADSLRKISG